MKTLDHQRKILVLNLVKQRQTFAWVYITIIIIVVFLLLEKKIKFKADNKNVNFPTQFRLGSISNWFSATESRELSLKRNVHDYSLDCSTINKSEILNIHNYLMVKNNIFKMFGLIKQVLFGLFCFDGSLATKCVR